jgi:hypothetical protein
MVKPFGNFDTTAMGNACSTLKDSREAISCNSALFPFNNSKLVSAYIVSSTDGSSVENTQKLVFKKVEQEFLRELFNEDNYLNFSMNSNIEFFTPYFALSYSPYYVLADILVSNPAFPEISVNLLRRSSLKLTSGVNLSEKLGISWININAGGSLIHYRDKYSNSTFSLISLSSYDMDELIPFETKSPTVADVGTFFEVPTLKYLPQFSLQVKNLGSNHKIDKVKKESKRDIQTSYLLENYSTVGLGYNFSLSYGQFFTGVDLPFYGVFEKPNDYYSMGFKYSLNLFSAYASVAKYFETFGLKFATSNTAIGILYSHEKPIKGYNMRAANSVYLSLEFMFQ